ncbi:MAG: FtsX-like permease family protein [Thermodesulfobacteriota bacterium]|nr:FtsX-like permease family protein [Thermodesulfobacteriota bacterium]
MIAPKLAYRNLMGAKLRTWLNIIVLSMAYVIIIWQQGFLDGWNRQALRDMIEWEIGSGQYWHQQYDPYDSFSIEESHATVPASLTGFHTGQPVAPILIAQATIYPQGRMQSCLLKGIEPGQTVLKLPTADLKTDISEIPVLIGTRMAKSANLNMGDRFTVRWRDANGTFDAAEAKVVRIMKTTVATVEQGQLWLPIKRLQKMMQMPGEATIIVTSKAAKKTDLLPGWIFRDRNFLSQDLADMIRMKKAGGYIFYIVLLSLALLAIFDTQVLAIFRRSREIGTLIALGMTRGAVIRLFTFEGAMHGILAAIFAAVYGIPLLSLQTVRGFAMPEAADSFGLAIAERIYPVYSAGLVIGTTLIVLIAVTIVSFMPTRRITKLNPTDAIKGKLA